MNKTMRAGILALCLALSPLTALAAPGSISLSINNGSVKDVLTALSSISGRSIVADDSVTGNISIDMHDVDFPTAMDIVTRAKNLSYKDYGDIVLVSSAENMNKNGDVSIYKLNYAKAEEVQKSLSGLMTNGGKTSIDAVTNSILFTGSSADEAKVRNAIKALDVATQQVTLEAKIIAINREDTKKLGISWTWENINSNDTTSDEKYPGIINYGSAYQFRYMPTLNALMTTGKAKILATPRVITIPGKQAQIFIGDHIPVTTETTTNGTTSTSTTYVDAGIKLQYTPIVSSVDGLITSVVHTEVSSAARASTQDVNYTITSRTADTNVRMRNGETLVIGGLINEEEQRNIQALPILSKIPFLGELFKLRTTSKKKIEVIMLLTPYLTEAGNSPAIYNEKELQDQFKDFDDKNFNKEVKKGEKADAEAKLKAQQRQVQKEMNEVQKEYQQADAQVKADEAAANSSVAAGTAGAKTGSSADASAAASSQADEAASTGRQTVAQKVQAILAQEK